jgi:chaperonin GroES
MKNFYPMNDFIYVKPAERQEKTESGLYLSEGAQDPCDRGEILGLGPNVDHDYKVGDTVLFARHVGTAIKVDGEERMVLHEEAVYGVIG